MYYYLFFDIRPLRQRKMVGKPIQLINRFKDKALQNDKMPLFAIIISPLSLWGGFCCFEKDS